MITPDRYSNEIPGVLTASNYKWLGNPCCGVVGDDIAFGTLVDTCHCRRPSLSTNVGGEVT